MAAPNAPQAATLAVGVLLAACAVVPATAISPASQLGRFLVGVDVISGGGDVPPTCPPGTDDVGVDLNDGAGGNYIFLCLTWDVPPTPSTVISDIVVTFGACPAGYTRLPEDLNQGAGGAFVHMCFLEGSTAHGITDVKVGSIGDGTWMWDNHNLNEGAGGTALYLGLRKCKDGYFDTDLEHCDDEAGCASCRCTGGFYHAGASGCAACPAGEFSTTTPDDSPTECTECPAGKSTNGDAARSYCSSCPSGTYQASDGQPTCDQCPGGTYSGIGWASCQQCAAGKYAEDGWASCYECPGGTFSGPGSEGCTDCEAGHFSDGAAADCDPCNPGKYSLSGASGCINCPSGTFATAQAAPACTDCPAGYFSGSGQEACEACDPGTWSGDAYSLCAACADGTSSDAAQGGPCPACSAGRFATEGHAAPCEVCPEGTFSDSRAASCTLCAVGRYGPTPELRECIDCAAGTYQGEEGQAACQPCAAGRYMFYTRATVCERCDAGRYQDEAEQIRCKVCPPGRFGSVLELETPECSGACAAGWFCPGESVSETQEACGGVHVYCPTGSPAPVLADDGYYTTPEELPEHIRQSQALCPAGEWCRNGVRRACYAGAYCDTTGLSTSTRVHLLTDPAIVGGADSGAALNRAYLEDDDLAFEVVEVALPASTPWAEALPIESAVGDGAAPEQTVFWVPTLASSLEHPAVLPDADVDHLLRAVQEGAAVVVNGDAEGHGIAFLNRVFRWSLEPAAAAASKEDAGSLQSASAPPQFTRASIIAGHDVHPVATASLPGSAERVYAGSGVGDDAGEWVFVQRVGAGRVVFIGATLGVNPFPADWLGVVDEVMWHLRPGAAAPRELPRVDLLWDSTGRLFDTGFGTAARNLYADLLALGHEVVVRPTEWAAEAVPDTRPTKSAIVVPAMQWRSPRAANVMHVEFQLALQARVAEGAVVVWLGDRYHNADELLRQWFGVQYGHMDDGVRSAGEGPVAIDSSAASGSAFGSVIAPFQDFFSLGAEFVVRHDAGDACQRAVVTGPPAGGGGAGPKAWTLLRSFHCGSVARLAFDWTVSGHVRRPWTEVLRTTLATFHDLNGSCVAAEPKCRLDTASRDGQWVLFDSPTDLQAMTEISQLSKHAAVLCTLSTACPAP